MFNIKDFLDFLEGLDDSDPPISRGYVFWRPSKDSRPEFPYLRVTELNATLLDRHQVGVSQRSVDLGSATIEEVTTSSRYSLFSITAISEPLTDKARELSEDLYNFFLGSQRLQDWLDERKLSLQLISDVQARYVLEDAFNEAQFGFDIQIGDTVEFVEDKEYVDVLTIKDKDGKVDDVVIDDKDVNESGAP